MNLLFPDVIPVFLANTSGSGSGKIPDALVLLLVFIAIVLGVLIIGIPLSGFYFIGYLFMFGVDYY